MGRRFEFQIRGRALICLALWLLLVPLRWAAGAVLAAAIHELGHMTALWMWSVPVLGMEIDLTGAVIRTAPLTQREELCCALAGPLAGGMLCLFWRWFPEAAVCAGVQTAFNLIPVYPLDGGRVWLVMRNICCKPGQKGVQ